MSPVFASADRSVSETLKQSGSVSRKRKRSGNNSYSAEQRAQIADYARQNGNTAAARHFSIIWNMDISESSVRGMKKDLVKRLRFEEIDKVVELPIKTCGRPTPSSSGRTCTSVHNKFKGKWGHSKFINYVRQMM